MRNEFGKRWEISDLRPICHKWCYFSTASSPYITARGIQPCSVSQAPRSTISSVSNGFFSSDWISEATVPTIYSTL